MTKRLFLIEMYINYEEITSALPHMGQKNNGKPTVACNEQHLPGICVLLARE